MIINFFATEKYLTCVPANTTLIITEEEFRLEIEKRRFEEISTTCSIAFNSLKAGDTLKVYDSSGIYSIYFTGEIYITSPGMTLKELRKEHNLEKIWRGGGFCDEVKEEEE